MLKKTIQLKRSNALQSKGTLKRKSTIKVRKKTIEELEDIRVQQQRDEAFYSALWASKPHKCQICDSKLTGEINRCYFDHILEKQTYKHLRYEEDNIAIVCMDCHSRKTAGFINEDYRKIINEAKIRFNVQ